MIPSENQKLLFARYPNRSSITIGIIATPDNHHLCHYFIGGKKVLQKVSQKVFQKSVPDIAMMAKYLQVLAKPPKSRSLTFVQALSGSPIVSS